MEYFERLEKKYMVMPEVKKSLIHFLNFHYNLDTYSKPEGNRYTSVYCDTPSLQFFRANRKREPMRSKFRFRSYSGINSNELEHLFFEKKEKWGKTGYKKRIEIFNYPKQKDSFLNWFHENSFNLEQYIKAIDVSEGLSMSPVVMVNYKRVAWADKASNVRITLDEDLFANPLPSSTQTAPTSQGNLPHISLMPKAPMALIEVKALKRNFPPLLKRHLSRLGIKSSKFSKYEKAVVALKKYSRDQKDHSTTNSEENEIKGLAF